MSATDTFAITKWEVIYSDVVSLNPRHYKPAALFTPNAEYIDYFNANGKFTKCTIAGGTNYDGTLYGDVFQSTLVPTTYFIILQTTFTVIPSILGTFTMIPINTNSFVTTDTSTVGYFGTVTTTYGTSTYTYAKDTTIPTSLDLSYFPFSQVLLGLDSTKKVVPIQDINSTEYVSSGAISPYTYNSVVTSSYTYNTTTLTLADSLDTFRKRIITQNNATSDFIVSTGRGTTIMNKTATGNKMELLFNVDHWIYILANPTTFQFYPTVQEGRKLVGSIFTGNNYQGYGKQGVAMSKDTNGMFIGSYSYNANEGCIITFFKTTYITDTYIQENPVFILYPGSVRLGECIAVSSDSQHCIGGMYLYNSGVGGILYFYDTSGGAPPHPIWSTPTLITFSGNVGNAGVGYSAALNDAGDILAVGGPFDSINVGAVWIFTRVGAVWTQRAKIAGTGYVGINNPQQGTSVALNSAGTTLAIGAPYDNGLGSVFVFTGGPVTWTQAARIVVTDIIGSYSNFGYSVALNSSGSTLAISSPNDGNQNGAVWIFIGSSSNTIWTYQTKLIGYTDIGNSRQGTSISISDDGDTLAVGCPYDDVSIGSVLLFTRSTATGTIVWSPETRIVPTNYTGSVPYMGSSVSVSAAGTTLIFSGYGDDGNKGAFWRYTYTIPSGGSSYAWTLDAKYSGTGATTTSQGQSVDFSGQNRLVIGRNVPPYTYYVTGSCWIYDRLTNSAGNTQWLQTAYLVPTSDVKTFGSYVAISVDGRTVAVGCPFNDNGIGCVVIMVQDPVTSVWSEQQKITPPDYVYMGTSPVDFATGVQIGNAIDISSDGNLVAIGAPWDAGSVGATWLYRRVGTTWYYSQKLVGTSPIGNALQGTVVSLSRNGLTLASGGYMDNSGVGATWVYNKTINVYGQITSSKFVGSAAVGASSQGACALSQDGTTMAIGGEADNASVGAAWVFNSSSTSWQQYGSKLVGTGATGTAQQGFSSAISRDGFTVAVGGPTDNGSIGAVWVYTWVSGTWTQQGAKLVGTGATGASQQGYSVALSSDGNTLAVGGQADNGGIGAAWIYTRSSGTWTQQGAKLVGTGATGASQQGTSIALSDDGNMLVIGAFGDNALVGAAFTFTRSAGVWTFGQKLVGSGVSGNPKQGTSIAINALGTTFALGGPEDNGAVGAIWVFTYSAGTWTQEGSKITGSGGSGASRVGYSVALTGVGDTLIGGGPTDNANAGAFWMYTRSAGVWTQQGSKVTMLGGSSPQIGYAVSLSTAGTTLLTSGRLDSASVGGIIVFDYIGSTWYQKTTSKVVGTGASGAAQQGISLCLSGNGDRCVSGGSPDNANVGAVWMFLLNGASWVQQYQKLVGTGATGAARQGVAVALSSDGNTLAVGGHNDNANVGAVWVYTRTNGVWTQQGSKLVGTGNTGASQQGVIIALSGDGNTLASGGTGDNGGIGATWIFTRSSGTWSQVGSKLVGTGNTGASVQGKISLSRDGLTLAVGGPGDNGGIGAMWIFRYISGSWTQQGAKLVGTNAVGAANMGFFTTVNENGSVIVMSGRSDNTDIGACWTYTETSTNTWTELGLKLVPLNSISDPKLHGVGISDDGTVLVVGLRGYNTNIGATSVYTRSSSSSVWTLYSGPSQGAGNTGASEQGLNVAMAGNGRYYVTGGKVDNASVGAAWLFSIVEGGWTQTTKLIGTGNIGASNQGAPSLNTNGTILAVGGPGDNAGVGATWIYTLSAGSWSQLTKLIGTGNVGTSFQGFATSISGDGNTLAVGGYGDNSNVGATWIFTRTNNVWTQRGSKLVGSGYGTNNPYQGTGVALSDNGNEVAIGGYLDGTVGSTPGATWIFV